MLNLLSAFNRHIARAEALDPVLPTLARAIFATSLAGYFWASALTKLGDGPLGFLSPSVGAYAQIFPRQMEALLYDPSRLGVWHWLVVVAGTWAEFLLPLLLILGLLTRPAALRMIGFVVVQTLTDLFGHGAISHSETLGAWFDRFPDGIILDQRMFWLLLLASLVVKGAGPLSLDRLLERR